MDIQIGTRVAKVVLLLHQCIQPKQIQGHLSQPASSASITAAPGSSLNTAGLTEQEIRQVRQYLQGDTTALLAETQNPSVKEFQFSQTSLAGNKYTLYFQC